MPHKLPFIIAIDGPNAAGKGTLARRLGKTLSFPVLDTGVLYRAVGWLALQEGGDLTNENIALHAADNLHELITPEFLGRDVLRTTEASNAASLVSVFPSVRQSLFNLQRNFALHPPENATGSILDGRDIGTVICPDAPMKFFVTAKPELRAERRAREYYGENWQAHFDDMLAKTLERDKRDSERATAPLKPAADAIMLDTSNLSIERTEQVALAAIRQRQTEITVKTA